MDKKNRLGFLKGGPLGPQSSSRTGRNVLRVNICTYLQHTGGLQVNIYIFTQEIRYMYSLYITTTTQDILCTFVHINKTGRGGPCPPPCIFGEAHYIQFLQWLRWDRLSHLMFFYQWPTPRLLSTWRTRYGGVVSTVQGLQVLAS